MCADDSHQCSSAIDEYLLEPGDSAKNVTSLALPSREASLTDEGMRIVGTQNASALVEYPLKGDGSSHDIA